ncbi:MAG: alpha/beta fold hydrolase [Pseudomonadota bacterium]
MTEIEAPGPQGPLKGSFQEPSSEKDAPVIIIIPGSGPTDRDGNSPMGVTAAPYKHLAGDLAKNNIASVRIDKRGLFGSGAAIPDPNKVSVQDYADDIGNWISTIHEKTGRECIWLLGHSEGGIIALQSALTKSNICGLILAATPAEPFGDVLRKQLKDNPANEPILEDAFSIIEKLEAGETVDVSGFHPALQQLFASNVQGYISNLMNFDPARMLSELNLPVLVIQGGKDIQVSVANAELFAAAKPTTEITIIPNANHVLKDVLTDDIQDNLATYQQPEKPLSEGVVETIAAFLSRHH